MKIIYYSSLLAIALSSATILQAQNAKEGSFRFAKADRPGLIIEYPYSEGIVENALKARFEKSGLSKPNSERGFISYQGASWPEITPGQVDIYAKVDGKGNKSTIVLLVSKGYDNYVSAASDPAISAKAKAFLESFLPDLKAGQLQADIGAQEDVVRQADKDYKSKDKEGNKQNRKKDNLDKQISENASEKAKTSETLNTEKEKLEDLKDQKK